MKVLKCESYQSKDLLVKFVADNKIDREDILTIVHRGTSELIIFFYGDPNIEQKAPGFWA